MNYRVIKKLSKASNIINCIYMIGLIILTAIEINGMNFCFNRSGEIYNNVAEVSQSSPSAGYEILAHMFGSAAVGLIGIALAGLFIITAVILLIFVIQNISGFLLFAKIKNEQLSPVKRSRAVLTDAIVKCITSVFFQTAAFFLLSGDEQTLFPILLVLPQTAVTVLAVISIVFYTKAKQTDNYNL